MKNKKIKSVIIPLCFILLGASLIVAGIYLGAAETVFQKAVRICMECIGIG